jgi:hypothetical protein
VEANKPDPLNIKKLIHPQFPLSDRMVLSMCGCVYKQPSFSAEMLADKPLFSFQDEFKEAYQ